MDETDQQEAAKLKNASAVELVPASGNVVTGESADGEDDRPRPRNRESTADEPTS